MEPLAASASCRRAPSLAREPRARSLEPGLYPSSAGLSAAIHSPARVHAPAWTRASMPLRRCAAAPAAPFAQASLPQAGEHVDTISTATLCCTQLRRTLDDIVDFDRIAAVRKPLPPSPAPSY